MSSPIPWPITLSIWGLLIVGGVAVEQIFGLAGWLTLYTTGAIVGEIAGYAWQPMGSGGSIAVAGLLGGLIAWFLSKPTASQKVEHLGLMFGALAASAKGPVKGYGIPLSQLTFGLLMFPGVWDWYLQWREHRHGFYTRWEDDMLGVILSLTRPETGWLAVDDGGN